VSAEALSARQSQPRRPIRVPRATYRLQLQPAFGFDDAAAIADYLAALGVSLTELSDEQAKYLGVPVAGPFKSEHYRY